MEKQFIPKEFKEKYSRLLGSESGAFFEACSVKIPKTIWVNSLLAKPSIVIKDLEKKGWKLKQLPFHENAVSLKGVERPGKSKEFKEGLFNLQEKAAMLPAIALSPEKKDTVLDATAAPGNKTLQLACLMEGSGKIVAVEKNVQRFKSLRFNMKKFDATNVICKRMNLLDAKKEEIFDKVLLDAPCSSEGMMRKEFDALKEWSPELVNRKAEIQKELIAKCFKLLKSGGAMVYSTCSFSPEENEGVVQNLLENSGGKAKIEKVKIEGIKLRNGFVKAEGLKFSKELEDCCRVFPQDNDTEQFFFAKIRKE